MPTLTTTHYLIIAAVIAIAGLLGFQYYQDAQPGEHAALAQCIAESDATFYGAFWCPHCAEQKEMFGAAADQLPYVECSTPDGQAQTQECIDAGVTSYPTWEFADGERLEGTQSLSTLAERTGCEL